MYCKNCNSYNDEGSRFCNQCGAELERESEQSAQPDSGYTDQYSQPYSQPYSQQQPQYSQPAYNTPAEPTPPLNNTMAIISIVLNVIIFNILGLIFAILSLTNYNDYESALRAGNLALSEQLKAKSKRYSKASIIIAVVVVVLAVLAFIAAIVFGIFAAEQNGSNIINEFDQEFFDEFGEFAQTCPTFGP